MFLGSPAGSPQSSDNSDTHHSGGSDIEMDEQMLNRSKHVQQRLSDTEVLDHFNIAFIYIWMDFHISFHTFPFHRYICT